ncbi:MAG: EamA family transporter [Deltaproteobacteria bacterium]|nr:MAG: EamA family transporter [Deltaproteobacteria bacterium]
MWVSVAFAAGCFQTARNALSRSLVGRITPALNSWSRFAFNLPFAALLVAALVVRHGWPHTPPAFYGYCLATALTQLLGNVALIAAFQRANFAQSILFHKLEVVITALVGVALFGEDPSALGWLGVVACGAGALVMNLGREGGPAGWRRAFHVDAGSLLALACAVLLVLASFMLKEAIGAFVGANPRVGSARFEAAAHTLFHTTWMEVAILSVWLLAVGSAEFRRVRAHWPRMVLIGAAAFFGSLCWFWAYSLTLVAYVKAVGQIEAILAVALALLVWKEREVWRQLPGVALVVVGIALVLLG